MLGLWTAAALAAIAIWFVVFTVGLSAFTEHGRQARLYSRFRAQLAAETTVLGAPIPAGSPDALLSVPRAGIRNVVVVEGTTSALLQSGPGHLSTTPLPGQVGVSAIFGRSLTFGAPFGQITRLRPGDRIVVTTGQGIFTYRVEDVRRPGSFLPEALPRGGSQLTLVTSQGHGWRNGWAPDHAVFVDAVLVKGNAQPVPARLPAAATAASYPMRSDTAGLVALVFWMEGLLLIAAAAAWTWARWGQWQTWLVGIPLLIALLWGATASADVLLPNLI